MDGQGPPPWHGTDVQFLAPAYFFEEYSAWSRDVRPSNLTYMYRRPETRPAVVVESQQRPASAGPSAVHEVIELLGDSPARPALPHLAVPADFRASGLDVGSSGLSKSKAAPRNAMLAVSQRAASSEGSHHDDQRGSASKTVSVFAPTVSATKKPVPASASSPAPVAMLEDDFFNDLLDSIS